MKRLFLPSCLLPLIASAHDIWIEPSASVVAPGGSVMLSLMLGNHGNNHRDFKLMSKVAETDRKLVVLVPPRPVVRDLSSLLQSVGASPTEGYWKTTFEPKAEGTYTVYSTFDKVMSYGPVRDIKTAKSYFVAGDEATNLGTFPMWHGLELVPLTDPAQVLRKAGAFKVRLFFKNKPLVDSVVNFLHRGVEAEGKFDPRYQKKTDSKGDVEMTLSAGTDYLIAAHVEDLESEGEGYSSINYGATIYLSVAKTASR